MKRLLLILAGIAVLWLPILTGSLPAERLDFVVTALASVGFLLLVLLYRFVSRR